MGCDSRRNRGVELVGRAFRVGLRFGAVEGIALVARVAVAARFGCVRVFRGDVAGRFLSVLDPVAPLLQDLLLPTRQGAAGAGLRHGDDRAGGIGLRE